MHHGAFAMFQSTLPAKGATNEGRPCRSHQLTFQSTLPAKGATLEAGEYQAIVRFQSTLPAKGATSPVATYLVLSRVSIHAPREGSDLTPWQTLLHRNSFNPRSPRRERPPSSRAAEAVTGFNPRSPRRERHEAINLCFWQMKPGPLGNEKQGQRGHPVFSLAIKIRAVWQ